MSKYNGNACVTERKNTIYKFPVTILLLEKNIEIPVLKFLVWVHIFIQARQSVQDFCFKIYFIAYKWTRSVAQLCWVFNYVNILYPKACPLLLVKRAKKGRSLPRAGNFLPDILGKFLTRKRVVFCP